MEVLLIRILGVVLQVESIPGKVDLLKLAEIGGFVAGTCLLVDEHFTAAQGV